MISQADCSDRHCHPEIAPAAQQYILGLHTTAEIYGTKLMGDMIDHLHSERHQLPQVVLAHLAAILLDGIHPSPKNRSSDTVSLWAEVGKGDLLWAANGPFPPTNCP